MNAGHAASLIARFIDRSYPQDKTDIFQILKLGINKAWQEGKWLGMTSEFFSPVFKDGSGQSYFMAPPSHPILLAVNHDFIPRSIRSPYFMFHRNGRGDIKNYAGCSWNDDVYDIGSSPYFDRNNINFSEGVTIGVRPLGPTSPEEKVYVNGSFEGRKIITYEKNVAGDSCNCSIDLSEKPDSIVNGIGIPIIANKFNYICNVSFTAISSISKTLTKSQIEIVVIDKYSNVYPIALLEPNQRYSKYRKYLVSNDKCAQQFVHGMFKIAQQEDITSETDELVISNEEALICFSKAIHHSLYKENLEMGQAYLMQGITILEKEKREEESPNEFPIQVDGIYYQDHPLVMQHYS